MRYTVAEPARDACYCHCRLCQRSAGAPVQAWGTFPVGAFHFTQGVPVDYESPLAIRQHCGRCGSQLTFRHREQPDWIDVTLASLDDPAKLSPDFHLWTSSQIRWLHVADALPRYSEKEE